MGCLPRGIRLLSAHLMSMSSSFYVVLADLIVAMHAGYLAFVLVGQVLIWVGLLRGWAWVRNPWFRIAHVLAIVVVALEAVVGMPCPLTVWEDDLRFMAGVPVQESTFVGRIAHALIRVDIPFDHWLLQSSYYIVAGLILITFVLAPPRFSRSKGPTPGAMPTA